MPGLDENALQYREIVRLQAEVEELAAALRASEAQNALYVKHAENCDPMGCMHPLPDGGLCDKRVVGMGQEEDHCLDHQTAIFDALTERAESAEKRERAYREALLERDREGLRCQNCPNPATTIIDKGAAWDAPWPAYCPEHAPEAKGGE